MRYPIEERLNQVMQIPPRQRCLHRGRRQAGPGEPRRVAAKMSLDPAGLLNPGTLRRWDLRQQIMADAAARKVSLATVPRFQPRP